jgi:hypothetical protein
MNPIFFMSESPDVQLKTNIVAGEETAVIRQCVAKECIGWSKNLDLDECPFCHQKMELTTREVPVVRAVNSCRNCYFLVKTANFCMKKQKRLSFQASDYSENCSSFKLERKATKKERFEKQRFQEVIDKSPAK